MACDTGHCLLALESERPAFAVAKKREREEVKNVVYPLWRLRVRICLASVNSDAPIFVEDGRILPPSSTSDLG